MDLQNQLHIQLNGLLLPDPNNHAPKVRKPYTISKQREKWTDDEHRKFLDALKLYGRAWPHIQEFIGTKTTVQIRSHAQKFFSKVVQGGNDNVESRVEDIEIPPPRPKRKPMHPYPRKYVDPLNVIVLPSFQLEKRIRSNSATADTENQSPNSVLSAAMTQTLEIPVSELPDSCLSNSSCSIGMQSENMCYGDREDNSKPINTSASSTLDSTANMCSRSCEKEADLPEATIKLFGKIVSTKDSRRPSTDRNDTFVPSEQHLAVNADTKYQNLEESAESNGLNARLLHGMCYGNWRPWAWHDINFDSTCASMQWMPMPLYTGLPPPYLMAYSQHMASLSSEENTLGKELCSSSTKNEYTGEIKDEGYPSSSTHTHKSGFVPYKRCSATVTVDSAKMEAGEEYGRPVQLCL